MDSGFFVQCCSVQDIEHFSPWCLSSLGQKFMILRVSVKWMHRFTNIILLYKNICLTAYNACYRFMYE